MEDRRISVQSLLIPNTIYRQITIRPQNLSRNGNIECNLSFSLPLTYTNTSDFIMLHILGYELILTLSFFLFSRPPWFIHRFHVLLV